MSVCQTKAEEVARWSETVLNSFFVKPESFQESDLEICCMLVLDFW